MAKNGISMPCTLRSIPDNIVCIYKIQSPSGKVYIGSTIDLRERIKHYICFDCKAQRKLFFSFKKYGLVSHILSVIEICEIDKLFTKERKYGELYDVLSGKGLNLALPGDGKINGILSVETIEKMKLSQTKERNNFYGRKHTSESIAKMRQSQLNRSPETLLKMSISQRGKKKSAETLEKHRKIWLGRKHGAETKEKMRLSSNNIKWVLNTDTGIYYLGVKEAALTGGVNPHTLKNMLNGSKRNKTSFIYV